MARVKVYFEDKIPMIEIMEAAASIGCTLQGDGRGHVVIVHDAGVAKAAYQRKWNNSDQLDIDGCVDIPAFLKPQAE